MTDGEEKEKGVNDDKVCTLVDFIINNLKDFTIIFSSLRVFSLRCGPLRNSVIMQKLGTVIPTRSCQLVPVEGLWLDESTELVLALHQPI